MSNSKPNIEPIGLRKRQGCMRWLMLLVLIAVVLTMVLATAVIGF